MNKSILMLILGLVIGTVTATWFARRNAATAEDAPRSESLASQAESPEGSSPGTAKLSAEQQEALGVTTATLAERAEPREIRGFGRVLDASPLADAIAEIQANQATLDASRKEFERAEALFARDQNVSARAVEEAEAAMKRDQAQLDTAKAKIVSQWGKSLAERRDLAGLVQSLIANEGVLIRIDVPWDEALGTAPAGARIFSLADDRRFVESESLGFAPMTDAQVQGQGFLFLVTTNTLVLRPGMAVIGYLELAGDASEGMVVPSSAVVRDAGDAWVYVQVDDTTFVRRQVLLNHAVTDGWLIEGGLGTSDRVVTSGAQMLLAGEQQSKINLGD